MALLRKRRDFATAIERAAVGLMPHTERATWPTFGQTLAKIHRHKELL
jgi:hypothetical protein